MNKRELYKLLEKLYSAQTELSKGFLTGDEIIDRRIKRWVGEIVSKDLNEAIETAEYLQEMAS